MPCGIRVEVHLAVWNVFQVTSVCFGEQAAGALCEFCLLSAPESGQLGVYDLLLARTEVCLLVRGAVMLRWIVRIASKPERLGRTDWLNQQQSLVWLFPGIRHQKTSRVWAEEPRACTCISNSPEAPQRRAVWCAVRVLSVYTAGIASLFTTSIQTSQLAREQRDHYMTFFFFGGERAQGVCTSTAD